jgi:ABC-type polysaccharide/polyol phosphate transport system ATPase subunit
MCDRALWIDHGSVMMVGGANEVLEAYEGRGVAHQGI